MLKIAVKTTLARKRRTSFHAGYALDAASTGSGGRPAGSGSEEPRGRAGSRRQGPRLARWFEEWLRLRAGSGLLQVTAAAV